MHFFCHFLVCFGNNATLKGPYHHFTCLSLIYSLFIHVMLLTIISQSIKPYFSFLIFCKIS
ncbi:hypothetical protein LDENG_00246920 [Lucifuga dentata]|nr:hypothetical protein LDENG_00246920 [Lucifuga dentata]